ncbi:PstC family ABC transporter permease [Desulfatitalea alkaliphila]|uniref:ABC transporter permease subunit n=1 Tax=Desulfatitalea alkaliphila TaxID=2929485 RepID=A0AA41R127_9BACT|nr:ABC transporter permease subunit [Desulfatitalea alkaliphila]MCJ8499255.1 ABC transporter permease subunit [Desulfatitalea alkaliphila]
MPHLLRAAALACTAAAGGILLVLIYLVLPLFTSGGWGSVIAWQWLPFQGRFGILPMVVGTLLIALGALAVATPLAVGVACFVQVLAPGRIKGICLALVHYMTSIPTVIYGFVSIFLLVPLIRQWFDRGTGFSLATATIVLSLLILPTIVLVLQATLRELDRSARVTCAALGFSRPAYIRHVLLPLCRRGLLAAVVLGFGRAVGDTLISLMLAGNAPMVPASPLDATRTLTAHIALVVATDSQSTFYHSVFAAGLILFLVMVLIQLILRRLGGTFTP